MRHNKLNLMVIGILLITAIGCADLGVIEPGENTAWIVNEANRSGVAFAIGGDRWVTAGHVTDDGLCWLQLVDGLYEVEKIEEKLDIDLTVFRIAKQTAHPLPLCRKVFWGQPVTHVRVNREFSVSSADGVTIRMHDDRSDDGPWEGDLVKTDANTKPGWSGGPTLGYDIKTGDTCVVGMTVAGDERYGYSWILPVRAIRQTIDELEAGFSRTGE